MSALGMPAMYTGMCRVNLPNQRVSVRRLDAAMRCSKGRPTKLQTTMRGYGKFIVGGNWKCNGTMASVKELVDSLNAQKDELSDNVDVVVAPPFLHMHK
eukprot:9391802-Pyramimonas_sp.AAC.1